MTWGTPGPRGAGQRCPSGASTVLPCVGAGGCAPPEQEEAELCRGTGSLHGSEDGILYNGVTLSEVLRRSGALMPGPLDSHSHKARSCTGGHRAHHEDEEGPEAPAAPWRGPHPAVLQVQASGSSDQGRWRPHPCAVGEEAGGQGAAAILGEASVRRMHSTAAAAKVCIPRSECAHPKYTAWWFAPSPHACVVDTR